MEADAKRIFFQTDAIQVCQTRKLWQFKPSKSEADFVFLLT